MKRTASTSPRNRSRKKATAPESAAPAESEALAAPEAPVESANGRNVGSLEGALSVGMGVLFVIAAVFPRSLKQLLLLSLGGGLLYRGMTGHCAVYQSMGVNTAERS